MQWLPNVYEAMIVLQSIIHSQKSQDLNTRKTYQNTLYDTCVRLSLWKYMYIDIKRAYRTSQKFYMYVQLFCHFIQQYIIHMQVYPCVHMYMSIANACFNINYRMHVHVGPNCHDPKIL